MSLDLTKVAGQVTKMAAQLRYSNISKREIIDFALTTLRTADFGKLKRKVAASRTTWLVAGLVNSLLNTDPARPCPDEYTVLAADGSQIDVDRHRAARCYLLNIGTVMLHYGKYPAAELNSYPQLYSGDAEMVIYPEGEKNSKQLIEGSLLNIKRNVEECAALAELAADLPAGSRSLALLDGTLILWGLSGNAFPDFVVEALLEKGMLQHLDCIKALNGERQLSVASYISFPRGSDVVNALRVAVCPHDVVDTDKYCTKCASRECDKLAEVQDRDLFSNLLKPGERSSLFISTSSIVKNHYGPHLVYFFYLNAGEELARVELPEWAALDEELLNLTHSLVLDQCRKGQGYPVVLSESHEQAVVTGADRENFWQLVDMSLIEEHLPESGSVKSLSKRTRFI